MMTANFIPILAGLLPLLLSWEVTAQKCSSIADLGFILDSSGSLARDYQKEKEFLKQIAARFDISPDGSHAGVVTFSHVAKLLIKLNDHYDWKSFEAAVDELPLIGSYTRIDLALRVARDELFKESNGGRSNIQKVLVLITDGSQTKTYDAVDPGTISDEMRESGTNIVVVGVGEGTNSRELNHLAGGPGKWYKFENFEELLTSGILKRIAFSACSDPASPPALAPVPAPNPGPCKFLADIGFILDASGSLRYDFGKEKEFLKRVVSTFGISKNGFHAGVVTFSYEAELSIRFTDHFDQASFNSAVDAIPFDGGLTRIDKALDKADRELFTAENGLRVQVAKLLILITDGSQSPHPNAVDPGLLADDMRKRGFTIIVLGIGPATDPVELDHLAGGLGRAFRANSFDKALQGDYVGQMKEIAGVCSDKVRLA